MNKIILSLVLLVGLSSCAIAPSQLGVALVSETKEPVLVSSNSGTTKTGTACGKNYLGIYSTGDMSIEKAMENGKITKVVSIDKTVKNFILISEVCTIVKGN